MKLSDEQKEMLETVLTDSLRKQHKYLSDWNVRVQTEQVKGLEHYTSSVQVILSARHVTIPATWALSKMLTEIVKIAESCVRRMLDEAYLHDSYINSRAAKLRSLLNSLQRDCPTLLEEILEDHYDGDVFRAENDKLDERLSAAYDKSNPVDPWSE